MMKKLFIFSILVMSGVWATSQTLEDIGNLMAKSRYSEAKTAIDKYLTNPKNSESSEGWYYKGRIYNALAGNAQTPQNDQYALRMTAYDAFRKHQQLDKFDVRMKAEEYRSYLELYSGFYDLGARHFNNKDYEDAYKSFSKAQEVENFIISKNYTFEDYKLNKLDTALISNTALAALNAKDTANAVLNYRKLVNAGIAGKDQELIYQFLVEYYRDKKDEVSMNSVLAQGKAAYPANNFWNEVEMQKISQSGDKNAMFSRYEDIYVKDPQNYMNNYNYAIEMYNSIYKDEKGNDPQTKDKLTAILKNAVANDKGIDASSLMANHLFNYAAEYSTAAALIKGTGAADIKKKKELNVLAMTKMDEMVPYAEKVLKYYSALPTLTARQKVNYQAAAGYLSDIYGVKGNKAKVAEYDKIRDSIKF